MLIKWLDNILMQIINKSDVLSTNQVFEASQLV
jgi:hypothetical protein